eukprot:c13894_g1_i2.p1 GENE.c13894_g1_i2~~c13894_g1_i2.p1  ORF type:complete len:319 (+),score=148.71 c13894_g1_i2:84-1040(+)
MVAGKWCEWTEKKLFVCCALYSRDCCNDTSDNSQQAVTTIIISLLFAMIFCCVLVFVGANVCPPDPWKRFLVFIRLRRNSQEELQNLAMTSFNTSTSARVILMNFDAEDEQAANANLDDSCLCVICYIRRRGTVLPCGHSVLCEKCTLILLQDTQPCPTCRASFTSYETAIDQPTFRGAKHTPRIKLTAGTPTPGSPNAGDNILISLANSIQEMNNNNNNSGQENKGLVRKENSFTVSRQRTEVEEVDGLSSSGGSREEKLEEEQQEIQQKLPEEITSESESIAYRVTPEIGFSTIGHTSLSSSTNSINSTEREIHIN